MTSDLQDIPPDHEPFGRKPASLTDDRLRVLAAVPDNAAFAHCGNDIRAALDELLAAREAAAAPAVLCKQCGKTVEKTREVYATPVCFACLPPPKPLPVAAANLLNKAYEHGVALRCGVYHAPQLVTCSVCKQAIAVYTSQWDGCDRLEAHNTNGARCDGSVTPAWRCKP